MNQTFCNISSNPKSFYAPTKFYRNWSDILFINDALKKIDQQNSNPIKYVKAKTQTQNDVY